MNFLKKLASKTVFITLETTQITVKDVETGMEITRQPLEPYSCGRLIISHFAIFEDFLKSVLSELHPKTGIFAPSYIMHVKVKHDFHTPVTIIENRSIIDSCQHAGAKEVYLEGEESPN